MTATGPHGQAGVLVLYQPTRAGQAALADAEALAAQRDVALRVLVVRPFEREDVGCARCRQGAVIWNHELGEIVEEELEQARGLLGARRTAYESVRGGVVESVAQVAARDGAAVIVIPAQRRGPLRRLWPDRVRRLEQAGPWRVQVGSPAGRGSRRRSRDQRIGEHDELRAGELRRVE